MKKFLLTITIVVISLFINIPVNAASKDHSLIYDIESFSVDTENDEIIFKGWAFINNFHNYGGDNTKIEIIANDTVTGTTVYDGTRNNSLYEANCMRKSGSGSTCIESHDAATCKIGTRGSSCKFDNVGFTITFKISNLIKKIGEEKTITFKLKVTTNDVIKSESVAVSNKAAEGIENTKEIEGKDANIIVSGISDTASIRVDSGRVLSSEAGQFAWGEKFYWNVHTSYVISDVKNSTRDGFGQLKMYELKYKPGTTSVCGVGIAGGTYGCKTGKAYTGTTDTGWAYASWLKVDGSVKIVLTEEKKDNKCPSEYNNADEKLNCESSGEFEQVVVEKIEFSKTIKPTDSIYSSYPTASDEENCSKSCTDDRTMKIIGYACITQKGFATFKLDTKEIYSGGGFYFYADYIGTTTYEFCKGGYNEYPLQATVTGKYCDNYTYCPSSCGRDKETRKCNCSLESGERCSTSTYTYTYIDERGRTRSSTVIDGSQDSNVWNFATEHMQDLLEEPDTNAKTKSLDSNKVSDDKVNVKSWEEDYIDDTDDDDEHWEPSEEVTLNLEFNLYTACIDKKTAKVRYTNSNNGCDSDEVDGGQLYYIPLKQPTGTFPIEVDIDDVNVLSDEEWKIEYTCEVNNIQKIYKKNGSFSFIYRPISLSNPFPNRSPSNNWIPFMEDEDAVKSKMNRDSDKIEYEINLSQSDIVSIKNYNQNKNYTSLDTIDYNGNSKFLDTLTFKTHTSLYNSLGKCTKDCWESDSIYESGD